MPSHAYGQIKSLVADDEKNKRISFKSGEAKVQYHWALSVYWLAVLLNRLVSTPCTMIAHGFKEQTITDLPALSKLGYFLGNANCDRLIEAAKQASKYYGVAEAGGAIPALPAEDFDGTWYGSAALHVRDEAYDMEVDTRNPKLAAACGPSITGARPPIHVNHAVSMASAMSRHMCGTVKTVGLPSNEKIQVYIDKADTNLQKMPRLKRIAFDDLSDNRARLFKKHLQQHGLSGMQKIHTHFLIMCYFSCYISFCYFYVRFSLSFSVCLFLSLLIVLLLLKHIMFLSTLAYVSILALLTTFFYNCLS